MRAFLFLTFAALVGAQTAFAGAVQTADFATQAPIFSDAEGDAGVTLAPNDFGGGVGGKEDGGAGSAMVIQMAQPQAGYAPSNAGSNFVYTRSGGGK